MFERIKCYRNLRRMEKFLGGVRRLGEIIKNEEMIREANAALQESSLLKKKIWLNPKLAKRYNTELLRRS